MSKQCVTHHFACDCREERFKLLELENNALRVRLESLAISSKKQTEELERENAALRAAFKSAVILREYEDGRDRIQEYVKKGYLFSGEVVLLMNRTAFDAARRGAQP